MDIINLQKYMKMKCGNNNQCLKKLKVQRRNTKQEHRKLGPLCRNRENGEILRQFGD